MRFQFQSGERVYEVQIERQGQQVHALVDGQPLDFELLDAQPGLLSARFDGRPATIYWAVSESGQTWLSMNGCTYCLEKPRPTARGASGGVRGGGAGLGAVRSPMPAQVRAVLAVEGERVEKGATLLLLEAMKMEIRVRAPAAGRVLRLHAAEGQPVEKDQVLVEMEGE